MRLSVRQSSALSWLSRHFSPTHLSPLWKTLRERRHVRWGFRVCELVLLALVLAGTQIISHQLWLLPKGDVEEYYAYALGFWTRQPILHALPVEYPPLAILPFTLTLLPPFGDYATVFAVWVGALIILGYIGFLRFSTRRRAIFYIGYLVLGAAATLLGRFDIFPALVTLAALWAAERGRFGYAYALLAAGILLKLYPAFLVPIVVVEQWRMIATRPDANGATFDEIWRSGPRAAWGWLRRHPATPRIARGVALCAVLTVIGFLGALILNPSGAFSDFAYASQRPLQVESTPASILWLGTIFGIPAGPNYSFVSLNYVGALDVVLKPLSTIALAVGCLIVYWRQARGKLTVSQAFVATLGVVLVANKIFSPQYLMWIVPIVAYVEGFDLIWVAICILTTCDFPIIYQLQHPIWWVTFSWQFMPVLALRNGLLLWATARAILRRSPKPERTLSTRENHRPIQPMQTQLRPREDIAQALSAERSG